jgi:nucleotide-binding universal stress UspA family protein
MLLDAQGRELASRLDVLAAELRLRGIPASRSIDRGDAIPAIMKALKATDADLLVLATHSKRGWAAFWSGSVAPRLLAQWRRPTLLVRAQGE